MLINALSSIAVGILSLVFGLYGFPIFYMTGGYFLSIFYFEISKKNQYYFYYNQGLTKSHLYLSSFIYNTLFGFTSILIINLCKTYLK